MNITGYTNSNFAALAQFANTNWYFNNNSFSSTPNEAGTWGVWAAGNSGLHNGGKFTRPSAGVHYVVFTYDTTLGTALNVKAYVDGVAQTITQTFSDNTASANFGNYLLHLMAQSDETAFWPATYLDEVRLSSSVRSAAWVTTEYNNQSSPGTFITIGSESCPTTTPTPTPTGTPIATPTPTPPPPTPTPTPPPPTPTPTPTPPPPTPTPTPTPPPPTPTPTATPTPGPTVACQRTLTIDHTKVPSTQSNFTVLVSLTDPALKTVANGGHVANANGYDIGFYADSGGTMKLKWEVEKYDGTTGNLIAWVKIPSVSSSTDTVFYLMYGNSAINTDQSDPPNTWDLNFKGVWHLGNGSTLSLNDSTSNGSSLANVGATGATTGKISGGAGPFNGTSQCLKTTSAINLGTNKVTLSAWVNITGYTNSNFAALAQFANTNWYFNNNSLSSTPNEGGTWGVWAAGNSGLHNGGKFTRPSAGVHYVVFTYDTTLGTALNVKAYVDGVAQTITQTFSDNTASANFGNYFLHLMAQSDETAFWSATYLDEVRLSSSVRSPAWVTTEYNNQSSPGTFITIGSESCPTTTPTPTPTGTPIVTPTPTPPPPTPTPTPPPPTPTPTPTPLTPTPTPPPPTPTPTATPTPGPTVACQRTLTIDHTKVPSTQSNFTALVSLTDPALKTIANGGHVANANGYDIGFYADSGGTVKLKWEVEKYDGTTGNLIAWVKIPSVSSSTDTVFYLMYGNSAINTDQSDPPNTWDLNFKGVWHLGNGSTLSLNDSTSNGSSLANVGATGATTGKISGGAGPFNGTSQCLKTTSAINLGTNKVTLSAWVNITGYTNSNFAALAQFANTNWYFNNNSLSSTPNEAGTWGVWAAGNSGLHNGGKFTRPSAGVHYVVFTYDTTLGTALNVKAYVDGVAQTITQTFSDNTASANFGNYFLHLMAQSDETAFWSATYLDEVRLSSSVRSPGWVTTEYNNQSSPGTFITIGSESCPTTTPTPTPTGTPIVTPTPTPPPPTPTPTPPPPTPTPTPTPTPPPPTPTPTPTATPTPTPLFVADNFNRQDGGLGLNWTKPAASENNLVIFSSQVEVDVENSNNFAFWSANNFPDDQVLANCNHEDRVVAWRNRAGGWDFGPLLLRGCCGAERLSDLSKMGRRLFSAGHWNDGDVASGRCVNAGGNWKRQSCDCDALPQRKCGIELDEQFERRGKNGRKPRDWNLFAHRRGFNTG